MIEKNRDMRHLLYQNKETLQITVLGLGYVGLPLLIAFLKNGYSARGFDLNQRRIDNLKNGIDGTKEVDQAEILIAKSASLSNDDNILSNSDIFVVTVPTPLTQDREPDLDPLKKACRAIAKHIKRSNIVIFESTVYPGATEEVCAPIIEKESGLVFNQDFFCGYSPERINPGEATKKLENIVKITSGSTPETAEFVDGLYNTIIKAGTHRASSIQIAEAAKVIENTQRDLNIALMNELSMIFHKLNIDTKEVIDAASTKWNFIPFNPGLVGGHCIGIDPYYLTYRSMQTGFEADVILAGRKVNDNMYAFVADAIQRTFSDMLKNNPPPSVLLLGATFKKNCPDLRNSQVHHLYTALETFGFNITIHDAWADPQEMTATYPTTSVKNIPIDRIFDAVVLTVPHDEYIKLGEVKIRSLCKQSGRFFDLYSTFDRKKGDWRL